MNYYNYYYVTPCEYFTQEFADGFSQKSEQQQVSSGLLTLLNNLTDLNTAAVWIV